MLLGCRGIRFKYFAGKIARDKGLAAPGPTDGGPPLGATPTVHVERTAARAVWQVSWSYGPTGSLEPLPACKPCSTRQAASPGRGSGKLLTSVRRGRTLTSYSKTELAGPTWRMALRRIPRAKCPVNRGSLTSFSPVHLNLKLHGQKCSTQLNQSIFIAWKL